MTSAPIRFLNAAFWPLTIWPSLAELKEHPADDFVERTSPIVAFAVSFWICVGAMAVLWFAVNRNRTFRIGDAEVDYALRHVDPGLSPLFSVLMFFTPLIYAVGFWIFTAREERFQR